MSLAIDAQSAKVYRHLVEYGFYWAKTIVLALSENSLVSHWVKLEAIWAVEQAHPVLVCLMDNTLPSQLHPGLATERPKSSGYPPIRFIDFREDGPDAQRILDELLRMNEFMPVFTGDEIKMNFDPVHRMTRGDT
jgi:hypothetical protein